MQCWLSVAMVIGINIISPPPVVESIVGDDSLRE